MRVSWFGGSQWGRLGAPRRKRRSATALRVRQLERRRVLDAAMQGLNAVVSSEGPIATDAADAPLVFDWSSASAALSAENVEQPSAFQAGLSAGGEPLPENPTGIEGNVRPVLVVALDQTANEGQLLDLSGIGAPPLGLFIDTNVGDTHTATVDWGDGSDLEQPTIFFANGSGALGGSHTYADDGVYSVTVSVMDEHGGSDTQSFTVTVNNVRPVLVVAADQVRSEGQLLNLSGIGAPPLGLFIDDGKQDTHTATVNWGDGSATEDATIFFANGSGALGGTHTYVDDGVYTVTVSVADDDGGSDTKSFVVTVNNVRPVLVVAADQVRNEGQLLNLSGIGVPPLGLFIDDGKQDTHTATVNWGDGSATEDATIFFANGSGALGGTHTYLDDGVYTVTVRVTDDDGGSDTKSFTVTVNNVRPVLVAALDQTRSEGQLLDLSGIGAPPLGLFIDDGVVDTHTATIDWGDGSPIENATIFFAAGSGALGGSHTYADDGVYTVIVTVTDDDGGSDTKSFMVSVANVAPSLANVDDVQVNEGSAFTLPGLNVLLMDPGFDNLANPIEGGELQETFAVHSIQWGDGTAADSFVSIINRVSGGPGVPTTAQLSHAAHTYADNGLYTVTIRVADDDMGAFADPAKFATGVAGLDFVDLTFTIQVQNVAPLLAPIVPSTTTVAEASATPVTFAAAFSDPGFDNPLNTLDAANGGKVAESFTYDIDWGDGRQQLLGVATADINGSPGVASTGMFGGSHIYADDGDYTVTVRIHDDDGGSHVQTFIVTVTNVDPAFVPIAGGAPFAGDDLTSEGITTIRVSFTDPGFDNPANPNLAAPPAITDTLRESFTHLIHWGDGTVDAVHTYAASGVYTVTVTVDGPGGSQAFSFPGFDSSLQPVLTLVGGQSINDPAVPLQAFTYVINWGDGAVQTVPLLLKAPASPLFSNGLTTVLSSQRISGGEGVPTSGSFDVQHRYLGPPDPANAAADIPITVTIVDDNNGRVSDFILISNLIPPQTTPTAIDTTPDVPRLEIVAPVPMQVILDQQTSSSQSLQSTDTRVARGELLITSDLYLELEVISPDDRVISTHRISDEALLDLRAFFATLPDNRYRIYLVRTENNSRRFIMEVYVRRGRVIDPSDDSEGTRDRPPRGEETIQVDTPPLDENPLLEQVPNRVPDEGANGPAEEPAAEPDSAEADPTAGEIEGRQATPRSFSTLRWLTPLAGFALAAGRGNWSQRVDAALQQADDRAWQRLRRAARLGQRGASGNCVPTQSVGTRKS